MAARPGAMLPSDAAAADAFLAGILNADDAILASLMPNPYRAAALARAHNGWIRERWLDQEARLRGAIVCPAQDPKETDQFGTPYEARLGGPETMYPEYIKKLQPFPRPNVNRAPAAERGQ